MLAGANCRSFSVARFGEEAGSGVVSWWELDRGILGGSLWQVAGFWQSRRGWKLNHSFLDGLLWR